LNPSGQGAHPQSVLAQEAAACEANGTCRSRVRIAGAVYLELSRQAARLRQESEAALARLEKVEAECTDALHVRRTSPRAVEEEGLLPRVEGLHTYTVNNIAALAAWALFFVLVVCMELMVVLVKLVLGETVDDHQVRVREKVSHHRATSYLEGVTSRYAGAAA
jgi:hypothetical protein